MTNAEPQTLQGQVAMVIGGVAPGGRAVARRLATEGAIVVLCDLDDAESAAAADELAAEGLTVQGTGIDVGSSESVRAAFDLVQHTYGSPSVLAYGIGFHLAETVTDTHGEQWRYGMDTNVTGAWHCVREFLRRLKPHVHHAATIVFLLSEFGATVNDALTSVTVGALQALARAVERDPASFGAKAAVILGGPLPGSGAERILRETADRKGIDWDEYLAAWKQQYGDTLTTRPEDVTEAVVRFIRSEALPAEDRILRVAPRKI